MHRFFLLFSLAGLSLDEEPILFYAGTVEPIRVHRWKRWVYGKLNGTITEALVGKSVAIAGESMFTKKVMEQLFSDNTVHDIEHSTDIWDLNKIPRKYDYIIFDKEEFGLDRNVFSQQSHYLLSEVLYPEFLLDGGYLSCCS